MVDGFELPLPGQGHQLKGNGQGYASGTVIARLHVSATHLHLTRRGDDLHTTASRHANAAPLKHGPVHVQVRVSLKEALLGFSKPVQLVDGRYLCGLVLALSTITG